MAMVTSEGDGSVKRARMFIKNVCRSDDRKVEKKRKRAPRFRFSKVDSRFLYLSNESVDDIEFSQVVQNEKVDDTKIGKFIVQLKCDELFFVVKTVVFCFKVFATPFFV